MKLELDLSDKPSLLRKEAELINALKVVRAALDGIGAAANDAAAPVSSSEYDRPRFVGDPIPPVTSQRGFQSDMTDAWKRLEPHLGDKFTTTDFLVAGTAVGHSKGFLRKVLETLELNKVVAVSEPAAGRRPAAFSKVNK